MLIRMFLRHPRNHHAERDVGNPNFNADALLGRIGTIDRPHREGLSIG